jgi:hypothetical protein
MRAVYWHKCEVATGCEIAAIGVSRDSGRAVGVTVMTLAWIDLRRFRPLGGIECQMIAEPEVVLE